MQQAMLLAEQNSLCVNARRLHPPPPPRGSCCQHCCHVFAPCVTAAQEFSALRFAVVGNHTEAVQLLLDAGANTEAKITTQLPDVKDMDGITDLMEAAYRGFADIAQRLLRAGADVESTSSVSSRY